MYLGKEVGEEERGRGEGERGRGVEWGREGGREEKRGEGRRGERFVKNLDGFFGFAVPIKDSCTARIANNVIKVSRIENEKGCASEIQLAAK